MPPPSDRAWPWLLLSRFVTWWYIKAFGTMVFMVLFFMTYFWVLRNPLGAPLVMPTVWVDEQIPFVPAAFYAYVSLWVYVSLPSALLPQMRELIRYGLWTAAMCLFCLALFWLLPTQTPVPDIDWANHPRLAFMKSLDASGNACPSLHVASAVYSWMWLRHIFAQVRAPRWLHVGSALFCLVIIWSTMAVRQHVFLDVLAGAVVGIVFGWLSLRHAPTAPSHEHT